MLGATYLVAQNVELQLNHSRYSGNKYDRAVNPTGKDQLTT